MPSTADERRHLVEEMARWCADVLKSPTRQANIARWMMMGMGELRAIHGNWKSLAAKREAKKTLFN
jgi:hypothetical protein